MSTHSETEKTSDMPDLLVVATTTEKIQESTALSLSSMASQSSALSLQFSGVNVDFGPYWVHANARGTQCPPLPIKHVHAFTRLEVSHDRRTQRFLAVAYIINRDTKQVFYNFAIHQAPCIQQPGVFPRLTAEVKHSHRHTAMRRLCRRFFKASLNGLTSQDIKQAQRDWCQRHPQTASLPARLQQTDPIKVLEAKTALHPLIIQQFIRHNMKASNRRSINHNKTSTRLDASVCCSTA